MAEQRRQPKSKYTEDREYPGAFEGETVTRRRLMNLTTQGAGLIAVSAFALPSLGFAIGTAIFERPQVRWRAVGRSNEFPDDTYIPKVITDTPGIGTVGKTTVYMRARNAELDGSAEDPKEPFIAVSTRCMHLGCPVRYVDASKRFICPCHGGVYDFTGRVNGGPPVRPLDRFYTRVRDDIVEVGPRFSVNGELERFPSYRNPAQDLDGVGQYLYPGHFSTPKQ